MFGKKKPEVLIAGAGPVGLFTALCLAQRDIAVQVVDEEWRPAAHSYALALHPGSLRLLDGVGLLQDVLEKAYRVRTVGLYDREKRRAEMRLPQLDGSFPFACVLRQDRLEALLERALNELGVKVSWSHRVARFEQDGDRVRADVDKMVKESVGYGVAHTEWLVQKSREFDVSFLIGADGHRSLVRRALDIPFAAIGEPQQFAVFEFATDADLDNELRVVLNPEDTAVMWPLPDGHCRWSFQLQESDVGMDSRRKNRLAVEIGANRYPVVDVERLGQWLEEQAPWFTGSIDEIRWRMAVRFERRLAQRFGEGRVWLAGDSAHMNYPVGAQSMNIGLLEGQALAESIADVLRNGAKLERLTDYGRRSLSEWRFLLGRDGGLTPRDDVDPWIGANVDRLLSCIPASRDELESLVEQLGLDVTSSATSR